MQSAGRAVVVQIPQWFVLKVTKRRDWEARGAFPRHQTRQFLHGFNDRGRDPLSRQRMSSQEAGVQLCGGPERGVPLAGSAASNSLDEPLQRVLNKLSAVMIHNEGSSASNLHCTPYDAVRNVPKSPWDGWILRRNKRHARPVHHRRQANTQPINT